MIAWLYGKITIQYFSNMSDNSFVNYDALR